MQPIILVLLDIPPMVPVLEGVVMELQDCALPLLRGESAAPLFVLMENVLLLRRTDRHHSQKKIHGTRSSVC